MDTALIQWIVQQVGLAGIAAFALWLLNEVWKQRIHEQELRVREISELRTLTLEALNRNTEAFTRFCMILDQRRSRDDGGQR